MKFRILIIILLPVLLAASCKEVSKPEAIAQTCEINADETVTCVAIDSHENKLEMLFDNREYTVTFTFNGETIVLKGQRVASGIWYKNDRYELRGKGEKVELQKDGITVFKN
ncbi:MAG: lysozyme inhibitor [Lentisphaerae bacterium]|nr:lysozyme inhibitor [Lentisphaerota bacterium]